MIKFEQNKKYFIKKDNLYELVFECTSYNETSATFMLVKIKCDVELGNCPVLFSMLKDYYDNFYGKMVKLYTTCSMEVGPERQLAFSDYENYLQIDSSNTYSE